jgi:hypothetical protein
MPLETPQEAAEELFLRIRYDCVLLPESNIPPHHREVPLPYQATVGSIEEDDLSDAEDLPDADDLLDVDDLPDSDGTTESIEVSRRSSMSSRSRSPNMKIKRRVSPNKRKIFFNQNDVSDGNRSTGPKSSESNDYDRSPHGEQRPYQTTYGGGFSHKDLPDSRFKNEVWYCSDCGNGPLGGWQDVCVECHHRKCMGCEVESTR